MAIDHISAHHGAHVFRCAGVNDVAGEQFVGFRKFADLLGHAPNHLIQSRVLLDRAIDLESNAYLADMPHLADKMQRANGCGAINAFANFARLFLIAHGTLQIAARHVQVECVGIDVIERGGNRTILAALVQRSDELDFAVIIFCERRVGVINRLTWWYALHSIGGLLEEKRWLAIGVGAHLNRMSVVVAANAVNPAHGELLVAAHNRQVLRAYIKRRAHLVGCVARKRATGYCAQAQRGRSFKKFSALHRCLVFCS